MLIFSSPWGGDSSLSPQLSVAPDLGVAVGDADALATTGSAPDSSAGQSVGSAQVATRSAGSGGSDSVPSPYSPRSVSIETPGQPGQEMAISQGAAAGRQPPAHHPAPNTPSAPVVVVKAPPAASAPVAAAPAPSPTPTTPAGPRLVANFENGLNGWSTSVLGDTTPRVVAGTVRDGSKSGVIRLMGDQSRSQLVLGGNGGFDGAIQIHDGDEFAFAFSFYVEKMIYGAPGADNLLMQLRSDASESKIFGLQLWDYAVENGGRGLWSSGEAVNGDRFLGSVEEKTWHDVIVHFKASSQGAGFYEVYLDGQLVDARNEVSLIAEDSTFGQIEVGLFRDGDLVQGTSEIRIDAAKFGDTLESVLP